MKAKHNALLTEARAITDKAEAEKRAMTPEEVTAFDAKMAEADALAQTIERQAKLAEAQAKLPAVAEPAPQRVEVIERKREPGEWLGTIVRAKANFGGDKTAALRWAEQTYGGSSPEYRALGWTDFTAGGAVVPDEFSSEIIPLLANKSVFRLAGATVVPLRGTLTIPKMLTGVTAYWVGENENITASEATFGQVKLVEKKLAAISPISNDLLRLGGSQIDRMIRDDIVTAIANAEDLSFFMGMGTEHQPKGIYYQTDSSHVAATAGTALANFRTDIQNCVNLLAADNVPVQKRVWFHNPRTTNYMKWTLVDANSNFAFPELREKNTLNGWPVYDTNNITTETNVEKYLVEMSAIVIGDGAGLEIKVLDGAAYTNSAGTVVPGFSYDQSVIRVIKSVDMIMRHTSAAAVRHTVTV